MLSNKFRCDEPKPWQIDAIYTQITVKNAITLLIRPTGDGKTLVIQGSAMALRGVTLLLTPTLVLTSFMTEVFSQQTDFITINLDDVQQPEEVKKLQTKLREMKEKRRSEQQRVVLIASPHTLGSKLAAKHGWCKFLVQLAKSKVLRLFVNDEAHLTVQHGLAFRKDEYEHIGR